MTNLERRLRSLEAILTDESGLAPHTARWLEYWDREMYLFTIGKPNYTLFPLNAFRAVLRNSGKLGSLVGSVRSGD